MCKSAIRAACGLLAGLLLAAPAAATWSIVIVDTRTREIGIGSATCLSGFDLRIYLPVLRVETGAGAAQSLIDQDGSNRLRIWNGLIAGTPPQQILDGLIANDPAYMQRQYGIVDTQGRAVTYTGSACGAFASGVTGQTGTLVYAIQGNVLTGAPVIANAEAALRNTSGGIPEKLMAAMEAARSMGGDGRCSCDQAQPTRCGSPPPSFVRSAWTGFMIVSRRGDIDSGCNASRGCVAGAYFFNLNYVGSHSGDPDPVLRLHQLFDNFRAATAGRPDQVVSEATLAPAVLAADGHSTALLHVEVNDWQGVPATTTTNVLALHDPRGSAGSSTIGPLSNQGAGVYEGTVTAGTLAGTDVIGIRLQAPSFDRYLMPSPRLRLLPMGDLNGDGVVDNSDIDAFVLALTDPAGYVQAYPDVPRVAVGDLTQDGVLDSNDIDPFVGRLLE